MKVNDWLKATTGRLKSAGIATARLDSLVLLGDALQKDRAWLLANPEEVIPKDILDRLKVQTKRRISHEPLAYIRGKSEFYGREFIVTPATLQPRPETETMIELLKNLDLPRYAAVADIGTGSGAVAITVKLLWPESKVIATEINEEALQVARQNAKKLSADVKLYEGNLLVPLKDERIDVILANLPYVPDGHTINRAAMQEPRIAIFGGQDGLDVYRELFGQINSLQARPGHVLTESLPFQHEDLAGIAGSNGYQLLASEDFIQVFRAK